MSCPLSTFSLSSSSLNNGAGGGGGGGGGDRHRIPGPEFSIPYSSIVGQESKKGEKAKRKKKDLKSHRPLLLRTDLLSQPKGSAYVEQGGTKVVCGVYGPREIPRRSDFSMRMGLLSCSVKFASFSVRGVRASPMGGQPEKEMALTLEQALKATVCLHLYPKSQIDVYVTVLEDDGATLAAALTCAGLALANASIKMFDLIIGVSACHLGNTLIIDPSSEEVAEAEADTSTEGGTLTLGYLPTQEQVAALLEEGPVAPDTLAEDIEELIRVAKEVLPSVQECLIASVKANLESKS